MKQISDGIVILLAAAAVFLMLYAFARLHDTAQDFIGIPTVADVQEAGEFAG